MADEVLSFGIRANVVAPQASAISIGDARVQGQQAVYQGANSHVMKITDAIELITDAACFLCSTESAHLNGKVLDVRRVPIG